MKQFLSLFFAVLSLIGLTFTSQAQTDALRQTDVVTLKIAGVPAGDISSISGEYPQSSAGTIALPYLKSEIRALGSSPSALARAIESAYKSAGIFTNPRVTVVPSQNNQSIGGRLVTVGGEVRAPGIVQWREGLTLLDAIMEKGGFTEFGKSKEVRLMRGSRTTVHNIRDVTKDASQNVTLQVGDKVIVPGGF